MELLDEWFYESINLVVILGITQERDDFRPFVSDICAGCYISEWCTLDSLQSLDCQVLLCVLVGFFL